MPVVLGRPLPGRQRRLSTGSEIFVVPVLCQFRWWLFDKREKEVTMSSSNRLYIYFFAVIAFESVLVMRMAADCRLWTTQEPPSQFGYSFLWWGCRLYCCYHVFPNQDCLVSRTFSLDSPIGPFRLYRYRPLTFLRYIDMHLTFCPDHRHHLSLVYITLTYINSALSLKLSLFIIRNLVD